MNTELKVLTSPDWADFELLDSGNGRKLERYGSVIMIRPEAEAVWSPRLTSEEWGRAHGEFITTSEKNGGHWERYKSMPKNWNIYYKGLGMSLECSGSRQIGVFPEQAIYWDWIMAEVKAAGRPIKVLNLFGYTGVAGLAAAKAGAQVTHVDASKRALTWGKRNAEISNLRDTPTRWMVDDVLKFVQREKRRGSYYEGIILDPPKFGRGPKGEVWEFYKLLPELLHACGAIMSRQAKFLALTAYSIKASPITMRQAIEEIVPQGGTFEAGELALQEAHSERLLPKAIFCRWKRR